MKKTKNKTYRLHITKQEKKDLGFKYDFLLQDYVYIFPVFVHNNKPLLVCKLGVDDETSEVWFIVCDMRGETYHPYYNREYGKSDILDIIDKNITKEFRRLGIGSRC